MGELMDSIGCNCVKKKTEEDPDYNNEDTEESNPKSSIKIENSNFIRKRTVKLEEIYDIICKLGKGAYGTVYKVKRKGIDNNIIRALKVIEKDQIICGKEDEITNEINILKQLDHPNIMKIYEFFEDEKNLYITCEFCDSGDLGSKMDNYGVFPEFLVKYVMYQVFLGVAFLHENKVFHGDLKRENIAFVSMTEDKEGKILKQIMENKEIQEELLSACGHMNLSDEALKYCHELANFELKILDFGSAKMKKGNRNKKLSGVTGTTYYCSPEIVKDKYDFESDEWACGVMMYILLSGYPPFTGDTEEDVFQEVLNSEPNFEIEELRNVSKPCLDLIAKLLEKDPSKRIKASDALKTDFFTTGVNIGNLMKGIWKENTAMLNKMATGKFKTKNTSKFKKAVIAYIALNYTDKNQEKIVKQIFRDISEENKNKKYLITKKTFVSHMKKVNKDFSEEELKKLFESIDENSSGSIEYEELMRALSDQEKLLCDKNLKEAFSFFDKDNSGKITWNEIAEIVFGSDKVDKEIIDEFLEEIEQKEDMEITFDIFKKIIKG